MKHYIQALVEEKELRGPIGDIVVDHHLRELRDALRIEVGVPDGADVTLRFDYPAYEDPNIFPGMCLLRMTWECE